MAGNFWGYYIFRDESKEGSRINFDELLSQPRKLAPHENCPPYCI